MMTYTTQKKDACIAFRSTFVTASTDPFIEYPWMNDLRDAINKADDKLGALKAYVASHDNQTGWASATVAQMADDANWKQGAITDNDKARRVRFITNYIGNPNWTWESSHVHPGTGTPRSRKSDVSPELKLIKALLMAGEAIEEYVKTSNAAREAVMTLNVAIGALNAELNAIEEKRKQEAEAHQKELDEAKAKASKLTRDELIALALKAGLL